MSDETPARATRRGRGAAVAGVAVLLGGLTASYGAYALLAPIPTVAPVVQPISAFSTSASTVSLPGYGAAAIGDASDGRIYAGVDLDTPRPIASITKVITALVVLDRYPISEGSGGETLTLTATDAALRQSYIAIGGTSAPAPSGLQVSQRHVIELMMVQSANNYAETLATWAFGSVDAYLVAARQWLDANDLPSISVADTTGFSPGNAAPPRALIDLGRIALADPVVSAASALPSVRVPGVGTYTNRNLVIGVDGVTGLKTGTLDEAGACLLFTAVHEINGEVIEVVGVVLGGPNHRQLAGDVLALLASVRDDYHPVRVATAGEVIATYEAPWGESTQLRVAESIDELVWGSVTARATVSPPVLQPGLPAPAPTMTVRFAGTTVVVNLEFTEPLEGPDLAWRLAQPIAELLGD